MVEVMGDYTGAQEQQTERMRGYGRGDEKERMAKAQRGVKADSNMASVDRFCGIRLEAGMKSR